ncbi:unnamed protein product [Phytophthora fragariaefolia]|uniref:Unnamed protein product n=1 Tax=Phytophthora fragariaefolia TaxID=1490495 RepID=A0A9W6X820_9STRA|nr:unnamed protein product [Phytophthora fragariaefolia]
MPRRLANAGDIHDVVFNGAVFFNGTRQACRQADHQQGRSSTGVLIALSARMCLGPWSLSRWSSVSCPSRSAVSVSDPSELGDDEQDSQALNQQCNQAAARSQ